MGKNKAKKAQPPQTTTTPTVYDEPEKEGEVPNSLVQSMVKSTTPFQFSSPYDQQEAKSESQSQSQTDTSVEEQQEAPKAPPPVRDEDILDKAKKAYKAFLEEKRDGGKEKKPVALIQTFSGYQPQTTGGDIDIGQDNEHSQTQSDTETEEIQFKDEDALLWYKAQNDTKYAQQFNAQQTRKDNETKHGETTRQNSLMGWKLIKPAKRDSNGKVIEQAQWEEPQTEHQPEITPMPKGIRTKYWGEDKDSAMVRDPTKMTEYAQGGKPGEGVGVVSGNTRYFSEEEQKQSMVDMKGGKLVDSKGNPVDTTQSSGIGTFGQSGKGRFIYVKGDDGKIRAVDPWEQHKEMPEHEWKGEDISGLSEKKMTEKEKELHMSFVNHSSLVAGGNMRAGGEIEVVDGQVRMVNDSSGHYFPDNSMLYDMVQGLVESGADPNMMKVGLVDKDKEEKMKKGEKVHDIYVGAMEFLSYGGALDAEQKIRETHEARSGLLDQITSFDRKSLKKTTTVDKSGPVVQAPGENELLTGKPSPQVEQAPKPLKEEVAKTILTQPKLIEKTPETPSVKDLISFFSSKPLRSKHPH